MQPQSIRVHGADGLRGLACLWVFLHHCAIRLNMRQPVWDQVVGDQGSLGVVIFFVLSGLLLTLPFWRSAFGDSSRPSLKEYAASRIGRIAPAYLVCLLVSWALFASSGQDAVIRLLTGLTFTNWMHWRTFFPAPVNSPLWSISIEVCFYVLLPVWALGLNRMKRWEWGMAYTVATQILLLFVQTRFFSHTEPAEYGLGVHDPLQRTALEWVPARNPLGLFSHFLFGSLAAGVLTRWRVWHSRPLSPSPGRFNRFDGIALLCIAGLSITLYPEIMAIPELTRLIHQRNVWSLFCNWPLFPALMAGLMVSLHFSANLGKLLDNRVLKWTAKLSYGIYLWHTVVIELLHQIWPARSLSLLNQVGFISVSLLISTAVAALSFFLLEQPAMLWIKERRVATPSTLVFGDNRGVATAALHQP